MLASAFFNPNRQRLTPSPPSTGRRLWIVMCTRGWLIRALGMKIYAINCRGASDEPTDWMATTDLLDEMLHVADILVISAALTTATEGLIGARELGLMEENAILINVARDRR